MWNVNASTAYEVYDNGKCSHFPYVIKCRNMTVNNSTIQPNVNNSSVVLAVQPTVEGKKGMTSLEISETTGRRHDNVLRDIRNLLKQGVNALNFEEVQYSDNKGEMRPMFNLTKKGCVILASGYDAVLRERIIDRLEAVETGQAAPMYQTVQQHVQQPVVQTLKPLTLKDMTTWAKDIKKTFNLNDSSTLELFQDISNQYGGILPIPKYIKSKGATASATFLFEQKGYDKKAKRLTSELNKVLYKEGILTKLPRKTSDGRIEDFWSITDKGSIYGENDISPKYKKKTNPLWYIEKFDEMLSAVGFNPEDYIKK